MIKLASIIYFEHFCESIQWQEIYDDGTADEKLSCCFRIFYE
jgi:hypothetical protein